MAGGRVVRDRKLWSAPGQTNFACSKMLFRLEEKAKSVLHECINYLDL